MTHIGGILVDRIELGSPWGARQHPGLTLVEWPGHWGPVVYVTHEQLRDLFADGRRRCGR